MPRRARSRRLVVAAAIAALCMTACSGGESADDRRRQLAEDLVAETDGKLGERQARCVADALHEAYGDESYRRLLDAVTPAPAADDASTEQDRVRTEVIDVFAGCDALAPIIDQP